MPDSNEKDFFKELSSQFTDTSHDQFGDEKDHTQNEKFTEKDRPTSAQMTSTHH